ncbi:MAG: hypothetical protein IPL84_03290 [Chitinophagaceae bacterium]|nr:hypothetical protein [Chitinophagaceae bacterium]
MTKHFRLVLATAIATTLHFTAHAQSLSVNTTGAVADPSAILDVSSTAKGMLIPRMDKTQKNAIATPANGLLVYQTGPDSIGFHYYDLPNTQWVFLNPIADDTTAWKITGNSNITASHFLGTLNDSALRFRVKNVTAGIIDSASGNTALGFKSLASNVNNSKNNVAIGFQSSFNGDSVFRTTAVGQNALFYNKNNDMVGIGYRAGAYSGYPGYTSAEHTSLGTDAGYSNFAGSKITAVGYRAYYNFDSIGNTLWANTIARNTAIGDSSMALTYGAFNTAVGTQSLSRARNSTYNVAVGDSSMGAALATNGNVAVGYKSLNSEQGQGWNTAVGYYSQRDSSVNTYYNTSIGAYSMEFNRTGVYNTGLGLSALRNSDSASYNTAIGADAMYNHRKNGSNVAVGAFTMRGDSSGFWNTAVGSEAMDVPTRNATGNLNTAIGFRAMRNNVSGSENTAVGVGALEADSSGNYNTAVGRYSSFLNKRGDFNVSLGFRASNNADTASFTTAIGAYAGARNKQDNNVIIGYAAGYNAGVVGGYDPKEITFVGFEAGRGAWASNKNTSLGFRALYNTDAGFGFMITLMAEIQPLETVPWHSALAALMLLLVQKPWRTQVLLVPGIMWLLATVPWVLPNRMAEFYLIT